MSADVPLSLPEEGGREGGREEGVLIALFCSFKGEGDAGCDVLLALPPSLPSSLLLLFLFVLHCCCCYCCCCCSFFFKGGKHEIPFSVNEQALGSAMPDLSEGGKEGRKEGGVI